ASEAHRRAISEAVAEGERLAAAAGAKPGADALARTFESLSLASTAPEHPGRLTDALQPAGFEALAGLGPLAARTQNSEVTPRTLGLAPKHGDAGAKNAEPRSERPTKHDERLAKAAAAAAERAAAQEAAEKKKHAAAVKKAEDELARFEAAEQDARKVWERAHDDLLAARQALTDVRRSRFRSP
ncbi:MAG: hypothetical protein JWL71_19, partial [Acidobacteria bacterium]|nr:hypothetical protein [Acidobacteriota bacterium]